MLSMLIVRFTVSIRKVIRRYKFNFYEELLIFFSFLLLSLVFFSINFFTNYIAGDFISYWLPHYPFLLSSAREGYLPMWNPYSVLGIPELLKLEIGYFYPPIAVTLLINFLFNQSNNLTILGKSLELVSYFHIFIGMLGTFLFARKVLKLNFLPSLIGSIGFSFTPFALWGLTSFTPFLGNMLFPLLMYITYVYLADFKSLRKYLLLVMINVCIFTLGDPYIYFYFFSAQIFLGAICFGLKGTVRFIVNYLNSLLISGPLLFPSLYILSQSYRSSSGGEFFSPSWSFLPTRLLSLFNPYYYSDLFGFEDTHALFSWSSFSFGVLFLILFLNGIAMFRKRKVYLFLLTLLIFAILYSLNYYSGFPEMLSRVIPPISSFRSHTKVIPLMSFSFVCFSALGAQVLIYNRYFNKKLDWLILIFLFLFFLLISSVLTISPDALQSNSTILLNSTRGVIFLGLYYAIIKIYVKTAQRGLLLILISVLVIELFYFYNNIEILKFKTSYSEYFAENSLIYRADKEDNLYRYVFDGNQFSYSTLPIRVFSQGGYESAAYKQLYSISRYGLFRQLQFSNVKYVISTNPQWQSDNPEVEFIKDIVPGENTSQVFISSDPSIPYWSSNSSNKHYVYEVKNSLSRFYIPDEVYPCNGDCLSREDPPRLVGASDVTDTFKNPSPELVNLVLLNYLPNTVEMNVDSPQETFVASSEILDRGWRIRINGVEERFYNTSGGFRGFVVPAGKSYVKMSYSPPFLKDGFIALFFGLLLLFILQKSKFYVIE